MGASGFGDLGVSSPLVTNTTLANLQNVASQFAINPSTTTGLTIGITGGSAVISPATTATPIDASTFTLAPNATTYISLTVVGVVVAETPAMTVGNFPLWSFTTNTLAITGATDMRTISSPFIPALGTGGGGGGSVTNAAIAAVVHASAANPATPDDLDEVPILDSAAAFVMKKLTWGGFKTALVSYLSALTSTWGISISGNATTATSAGTVTTTISSGVNATTQISTDNSTKVATTAFVQTGLAGIGNVGKLIKFTTITASGTFTKQAGTTQIIAMIYGGGGVGGASVGDPTATYSIGGLGGEAAVGRRYYTAAPPATMAAGIGAGGAVSSLNGVVGNPGRTGTSNIGGGAGLPATAGQPGVNGVGGVAGGTGAVGGAAPANSAAGGGGGGQTIPLGSLAGGAGGSGIIYVWEY